MQVGIDKLVAQGTECHPIEEFLFIGQQHRLDQDADGERMGRKAPT